MKDKTTGQFIRTREPWIPARWDDGYIDNRNRFRVYRPDYPRAWEDGYAHRAHIVWWLQTREVVPKDKDLCHLDRNSLNDLPDNLLVLSKSDHHSMDKASFVTRTCKHCDSEFFIKKGRLSEKGRGTFCSQKCFHAEPRAAAHGKAISIGLKAAHARKDSWLIK